MNIVVCAKVIADTDLLKFDVVKEEISSFHLVSDPINEHLLEEALRLREKGGQVIVLGVGPPEIENILRQTLRQGADRAVRVWAEGVTESDTWMISRIIKQWIQNLDFDLVLCGSRSTDTGSGAMVPFLASNLGLPCLSNVVSLTIETPDRIIARKKLERGMREEYELGLPVVVGLDPAVNEPRYVAPYSRVYCQGLDRQVETVSLGLLPGSLERRVSCRGLRQRKPRVKKGRDVSSLSFNDRLRLMKGELGDQKRTFTGGPQEAAKEILKEIDREQ